MEQIGPYKILRQLSIDGAGRLFEAVNEQIQRRVAIRVLHDELSQQREAVKRFLNEARVVNLITHPSIVNIYEQGQLPSGAPYIVMEYLHGETLRDRLRRSGGKLPPGKAMRIARSVASALAAAHAQKVVHRAMKPSSVMLVADADTPDGERVKVLSFGVAKLTTPSEGSVLTQAGTSLGTPTYMSPEQCKNASDVTDRSDVYALGIMLYEMLAGAPPFSEAEGPVAVMMAQMHEDPPALANRAPEASAELVTLVQRMLTKDPATRPSAADVMAMLAGLSGSKQSGFMPIVLAPRPQPEHEPSLTMLLPAPKKEPDEDEAEGATAPADPTLLGRAKKLPTWGIAAGVIVAVLLGIIGIIVAIASLQEPPPPPRQTHEEARQERLKPEQANQQPSEPPDGGSVKLLPPPPPETPAKDADDGKVEKKRKPVSSKKRHRAHKS